MPLLYFAAMVIFNFVQKVKGMKLKQKKLCTNICEQELTESLLIDNRDDNADTNQNFM